MSGQGQNPKSFRESYEGHLAEIRSNPDKQNQNRGCAWVLVIAACGAVIWGIICFIKTSTEYGHDRDRDLAAARNMARVRKRMKLGMTRAEVVSILGDPTTTETGPCDDSPSEQCEHSEWEFDGQSHGADLEFKDGQLNSGFEFFEDSPKYPHCVLGLDGNDRCWPAQGGVYDADIEDMRRKVRENQ